MLASSVQTSTRRICSASSANKLRSPRSCLKHHRTAAVMEETCIEGVVIEPRPAEMQELNAGTAERRPAFHLAPAAGWINDPNGPLLHNGTYHLFYQHVPNSSEWQWGLVWGHAKSQDLIHWEHLPPALEPTPNGLDQHGCFSGCATVDVDGRPSLLYTGVIRKSPHEIEPDVSPQHESQMIAVATDLDDPDLTRWQKLPGSFLPQPPAEMDLTGWRDPFVLEKPSADSPWWYVMIGAGVRNKCGTALVYRSKDLKQGWQYVGPLCESADSHMWECPILAQLSNTAPDKLTPGYGNHQHQQEQHQQKEEHKRHMLSVSPDYCVNMIQYWLGDYANANGKFDLHNADGPHLLDLGDIMYAPNVLTDKHGRSVLWAWMQEKQHLRPPGSYTSACCLCVPRALYLSPDGKHLMQQPLPELSELRQPQTAWHAGTAAAAAGKDLGSTAPAVPLPPRLPLPVGRNGSDSRSSSSSSVDLELQVAKGDADSFVLLLHAFEGAEGAAGAAIAYCWSTNTLQIIYSTDLDTLEPVAAMPLAPRAHYRQPGPDPVQLAAAEAAAAEPGMPMRCGGALRAAAAPADVITLRVLLDGSCLEVFTSTGEALGTRVYRGNDVPASPHIRAPQQQFTGASSGLGSTAEAAMAAAAAAGAVGWEELFSGDGGAAASGPAGGRLELVSFGPGPAQLLSGSMWQMSSMWLKEQLAESMPAGPASVALPLPAATAVTAAAAEVLQGLAEAAAVAAAAAAATTVSPVVLPVGDLSLDLGAVAADSEVMSPRMDTLASPSTVKVAS